MAVWKEEQRKMEENIHRHLQIPNNSWYATQLNYMQQSHKNMPPPLDNGSNILHTTIRICAKCEQQEHWGVMCTNLTSKPEPSINKCTFCKGHHKANTCKLRKKLMTSSGHANVQYVKDTMALEEDKNDPMHPDVVVANWLQDKDLTQQYVECMEKDNLYKDIYKRARDGEKILTIQYKNKSLYILKRATWKLIIPTGLKIRSKSVQEYLLQLAHAYTGTCTPTTPCRTNPLGRSRHPEGFRRRRKENSTERDEHSTNIQFSCRFDKNYRISPRVKFCPNSS